MKSILPKLTLLGGLVLTLGCGSPFTPRPLGVGARVPNVERRMVEYYDPFTDRSSGPDTQNRPREFSIQRAAPRRAAETLVPPGTPHPQQPPVGSNYPGVVRE